MPVYSRKEQGGQPSRNESSSVVRGGRGNVGGGGTDHVGLSGQRRTSAFTLKEMGAMREF